MNREEWLALSIDAPSSDQIFMVNDELAHLDLVKRYPEYYAMPPEDRITSDGKSMNQLDNMAGLQPMEILLLLACGLGIIFCIIALIIF